MSMSAATEQIMFNEMMRCRKRGKPSPHESNYTRLFGTPERAAKTLEDMELDSVNWCRNEIGDLNICKACPYEYDNYECHLPNSFSLLEWLRDELPLHDK